MHIAPLFQWKTQLLLRYALLVLTASGDTKGIPAPHKAARGYGAFRCFPDKTKGSLSLTRECKKQNPQRIQRHTKNGFFFVSCVAPRTVALSEAIVLQTTSAPCYPKKYGSHGARRRGSRIQFPEKRRSAKAVPVKAVRSP